MIPRTQGAEFLSKKNNTKRTGVSVVSLARKNWWRLILKPPNATSVRCVPFAELHPAEANKRVSPPVDQIKVFETFH